MQALGWSQYSYSDLAEANLLDDTDCARELDALVSHLPVRLQAAGLYYLGLALQARDALPRSQMLLERSLAIAQQPAAIPEIAIAQLNAQLNQLDLARELQGQETVKNLIAVIDRQLIDVETLASALRNREVTHDE